MSKPVLKDLNGHGLMGTKFKDLFNQECSILHSTTTCSEPTLIFGVDKGIDSRKIFEGVMTNLFIRAYISRDMAAWMWPMLKHFAKTGEMKI